MNVAEILSARLIGTMFVERGLLSESQIRVALEIQRETGQQLGQILVDRFGITRQELASVVAEQWADIGKSTPAVDAAANESWRKLGEIFVERGFVTREELEKALERQRETGERVGEALVAQGSISKFELAGALAEQMSALESEGGAPDAGAPDSGTPAANVVRLMPRVEETTAAPEPEVEARPMGGVDAEPETNPAVADEAEPQGEPVAELAVVDEAEPVVESEREVEAVEGAPEAEATPVAEPEREPVAELAVVDGAEPVVEPESEPEVEAVEDSASGAEAAAVAEPEPEDEPAAALAAVGGAEPGVEHEAEPEAEPVDVPEPVAEEIPVFLQSERSLALAPSEPEVSEQTADEWLAFASTTAGYRLVARSGPLPGAGSTLEVPEVGELLVLRVGRSPLPHDRRTCVFLEQQSRPDPAHVGL